MAGRELMKRAHRRWLLEELAVIGCVAAAYGLLMAVAYVSVPEAIH